MTISVRPCRKAGWVLVEKLVLPVIAVIGFPSFVLGYSQLPAAMLTSRKPLLVGAVPLHHQGDVLISTDATNIAPAPEVPRGCLFH